MQQQPERRCLEWRLLWTRACSCTTLLPQCRLQFDERALVKRQRWLQAV